MAQREFNGELSAGENPSLSILNTLRKDPKFCKGLYIAAFNIVHNRQDSEDAVCGSFARLSIKANSDPEYVVKENNPKSLVARTVVNLSIDRIRSGKIRLNDKAIRLDNGVTIAGGGEDTSRVQYEPSYEEKGFTTVSLGLFPGDRSTHRRVLKEVGVDGLMILRLRYVEDLSMGEISTLLSRSTGTIRSQVFRSRNKIRKLSEIYGEDIVSVLFMDERDCQEQSSKPNWPLLKLNETNTPIKEPESTT